jgi:hypothetical protein
MTTNAMKKPMAGACAPHKKLGASQLGFSRDEGAVLLLRAHNARWPKCAIWINRLARAKSGGWGGAMRRLGVYFVGVSGFVAAVGAAEPRPSESPAARAPETFTEIWSPVPAVVRAPEDAPPSDAIVLFDGKSLAAWEPARADGSLWSLTGGAMVVPPGRPGDLRTKQAFGDVQLHLEWRTPAEVKGSGQDRGNSGVFFMGLYELQVLDSFDNATYVNGQAAAVYKEHAPLVNASRAPGEWQRYDIVFVAPRFAADGRLLQPARMTAFNNGVLVQHDVVLTGPTPNGPTFHQPALPPYAAHAPKLPLVLQAHGSPVAFRNIWIRELALPEPR